MLVHDGGDGETTQWPSSFLLLIQVMAKVFISHSAQAVESLSGWREPVHGLCLIGQALYESMHM